MISSFDVIVRPNVPPDIRPPAVKIKIETEDDADVEIIGQRGQCIDLEHSQRMSATFTEKQAEQYRIFDRVWLTNPNKVRGNLLTWPKNVEPTARNGASPPLRNYVIVEVVHYIQYRNEFGHLVVEKFQKPRHIPSEGIFVVEENIKRSVT